MKYEVVVVGAGPAGSTAAKYLAEKGIKVLLVDKSTFPRVKPCGGGLPARVLKRFTYIRHEWIESISYGICAYSPSLRYNVELLETEPLIAMVLREKFDYELVKLAVASGATFMDNGRSVEDINVTGKRANVTLKDGTDIETQIVVGADGVGSTIAKKSGYRQNPRHICVCVLNEYQMNSETLDQFFSEKRLCHIHLNVEGIAGYGWVFPKKDHVNIGITDFKQAVDPSKPRPNLKEVYNNYFKILKKNKILPDTLKIGELQGGVLPTHPVKKTYADRVILCGDAGGLANPASGEGIYYAMVSGEIAADVIAEALEMNDTSERFLSKYQTRWENDFGKDLKLLFRASKRWGYNTEKAVKLASKDTKLAELAKNIITGQCSIHHYKWKLARRFLYLYAKDLLQGRKPRKVT